ncbi:hypothetical protein [Arcanobacterium canis]
MANTKIDFDSWTDEQEADAIKAIVETAEVKSAIVDNRIYFKTANGVLSLSLDLPGTVLQKLIDADENPITQMYLILQSTADTDAVEAIEKLGIVEATEIAVKYMNTIAKVFAGAAGKFSA